MDAPREPFAAQVQQARRDLLTSLQAYRVFCDNAIEILQRPNCTMRAVKLIVDGAAANLEAMKVPQAAIDEWLQTPLSDVGLDLPLGRITGDPNHGR